MNKLERMTAILLYLQESPRTSREIAANFEISRRTVLRDIQALSEMGVPVIARGGASGGYSLPEDYSLAPLGLGVQEAFLLLLALQSIRRPADVPFGRERASLEAKLRALLPPAQREAAEKILSGVNISSPALQRRTPYLDVIVGAIEAGCWLDGLYHSARRTAPMRIFPRHVHLERGLWYLNGFSQEHGEERTYRVDRFERLARVSADLPAPDPLPTRSYASAADPLIVARLTRLGAARLDSDLHLASSIQRQPDGSALLAFHFPPAELDWYVNFFAGLGEEVVVEQPAELRARLAELGASLYRRYSQGTQK